MLVPAKSGVGGSSIDMTSTTGGLVPTPPNDATKFLDGTGLFSVPTGPLTTGAQTFQGLKSFSTGWEMAESSARSYKMLTRTAVTTFPVPSVRPSTANTVIAFDLMPNGSATEYTNNGFAWFDVCDTDCLTTNPALASARVGITATFVEFGSRAFNGATQKPIHFTFTYGAGGAPVTAMSITSTGSTDRKVGIGTATPTSALQVVGLPVYANNAAAVAGGLTAGAFYRTGGDPDPVCVVH
jgi:hypothetical protein